MFVSLFMSPDVVMSLEFQVETDLANHPKVLEGQLVLFQWVPDLKMTKFGNSPHPIDSMHPIRKNEQINK